MHTRVDSPRERVPDQCAHLARGKKLAVHFFRVETLQTEHLGHSKSSCMLDAEEATTITPRSGQRVCISSTKSGASRTDVRDRSIALGSAPIHFRQERYFLEGGFDVALGDLRPWDAGKQTKLIATPKIWFPGPRVATKMSASELTRRMRTPS